MRPRVPLFAALAITLLFGSSTAAQIRDPRSFFEGTVDLRDGNVARIQAHLSFVVEALRSADTSQLRPELRQRRARHLERLDAYWRQGVFPRNTGPLGLTPIFIDDEGRACAVADLMVHSGARELADSVAACENYAYLPQIENPLAAEWIAESGLTVEECAMIQPSYPCPYALEDLVCMSSGTDVALTWVINADVFDWIWIERDGEGLVSLPGDALFFVDVDVPAGDYEYAVYAGSMFDCSDEEWCSIQHNNWEFVRGDANNDGDVDAFGDGFFILDYGFLGGAAPPCTIAADVNGDGQVEPIVDALQLFLYEFYGGPSPAEPFPACGAPGPQDTLGCDEPSCTP